MLPVKIHSWNNGQKSGPFLYIWSDTNNTYWTVREGLKQKIKTLDLSIKKYDLMLNSLRMSYTALYNIQH